MLGHGALGQFALGQAAAATDAVVTLTGVAGTGSAGTIRGAVADFTFVGVAGTGSPGTISVTVSFGLTGVAGTGSPGTILGAVDKLLIGVAASGSPGTIGIVDTVGLTGVAGTGGAGTIADMVSYTFTGVSAMGSAGTILPLNNPTIGSVFGTGRAGNVGFIISGGGGKLPVRKPGPRLELRPAERKITIRDRDGRERKVSYTKRFAPPPPLQAVPAWVLPPARAPLDAMGQGLPIALPIAPAPQQFIPPQLSLDDMRDENDLLAALAEMPDPLQEDITMILAHLHSTGQLDALLGNA